MLPKRDEPVAVGRLRSSGDNRDTQHPRAPDAGADTSLHGTTDHRRPFKITKRLTENGAEFTDLFLKGGDPPSGQQDFDQACTEHHIEHQLIPHRHPQTNGMVERFDGWISEILTTTQFNASEDLEQTVQRYLHISDHHIPQRALGVKHLFKRFKPI